MLQRVLVELPTRDREYVGFLPARNWIQETLWAARAKEIPTMSWTSDSHTQCVCREAAKKEASSPTPKDILKAFQDLFSDASPYLHPRRVPRKSKQSTLAMDLSVVKTTRGSSKQRSDVCQHQRCHAVSRQEKEWCSCVYLSRTRILDHHSAKWGWWGWFDYFSNNRNIYFSFTF